MFFFYLSGDHRDLHVLTHSFPTRRSSDLASGTRSGSGSNSGGSFSGGGDSAGNQYILSGNVSWEPDLWGKVRRSVERSEEHTSELQSLMRISYAVFCLKKKNTQH